jgi:2-oxoglutarate dehydrogenase E1 component
MSLTRSYGGYGLIHIIVNNQVGFTTSRISDNRSSRYSSDIAKMVECPIIHVNSDDLRAVIFACDLAVLYRQKFAKDIMLDLVCFRRHGHNEADDPTLTQPLMLFHFHSVSKLWVESRQNSSRRTQLFQHQNHKYSLQPLTTRHL